MSVQDYEWENAPLKEYMLQKSRAVRVCLCVYTNIQRTSKFPTQGWPITNFYGFECCPLVANVIPKFFYE